MPNTKFDAKSFNPQAFKYAVDRIPRTRLNEMRKSRALAGNPDIREVFSTQGGTGYARIAMRGLLDGDAVNYDGQTDITATSTKTFEQGVVVIGRAKAWTEKDFSFDITGGIDWIANDVAVLFGQKYLGTVPNDASGRSSLWGDITKLIQQLDDIRAVENFDPEIVTCEQGDSKKAVLCIVNGLNVINAMAQLYMSVIIQ